MPPRDLSFKFIWHSQCCTATVGVAVRTTEVGDCNDDKLYLHETCHAFIICMDSFLSKGSACDIPEI